MADSTEATYNPTCSTYSTPLPSNTTVKEGSLLGAIFPEIRIEHCSNWNCKYPTTPIFRHSPNSPGSRVTETEGSQSTSASLPTSQVKLRLSPLGCEPVPNGWPYEVPSASMSEEKSNVGCAKISTSIYPVQEYLSEPLSRLNLISPDFPEPCELTVTMMLLVDAQVSPIISVDEAHCQPLGNSIEGVKSRSIFPLCWMLNIRLRDESGLIFPKLFCKSISISLISITFIGILYTYETGFSVCETAVNLTILSAPAPVITCGGVNVMPRFFWPSWLINPVEPEIAPGSLPKSSNPACHPAGASKNRS